MPISAAVRRGRLFRRRSPITWRTSPGTRPRLDSAQLAPHARSSRATRAATPARPAATLAVDDAPEERARVGLRVARVWLRELSGPNGSYGAGSYGAEICVDELYDVFRGDLLEGPILLPRIHAPNCSLAMLELTAASGRRSAG